MRALICETEMCFWLEEYEVVVRRGGTCVHEWIAVAGFPCVI